MMKAFICTLCLLFTTLANADLTLESRNGMTHLHSEGMPIARYLSENTLTYTKGDWEAVVIGNVYGTQNWKQRVNLEQGWTQVDKVRFEYGGEIKYEVFDGIQLYTKHTMPINRNDHSRGDGWGYTSYRWESGFIFKHTW